MKRYTSQFYSYKVHKAPALLIYRDCVAGMRLHSPSTNRDEAFISHFQGLLGGPFATHFPTPLSKTSRKLERENLRIKFNGRRRLHLRKHLNEFDGMYLVSSHHHHLVDDLGKFDLNLVIIYLLLSVPLMLN